jgi:hypothetical protein
MNNLAAYRPLTSRIGVALTTVARPRFLYQVL